MGSFRVDSRKAHLPPPSKDVLESMAQAMCRTACGHCMRDGHPMKDIITWDKQDESNRDDWIEIAYSAYAAVARHGGAILTAIPESD